MGSDLESGEEGEEDRSDEYSDDEGSEEQEESEQQGGKASLMAANLRVGLTHVQGFALCQQLVFWFLECSGLGGGGGSARCWSE